MKSSSSLGVRETIKFIETEYVNIIHEILKTGKNPFFNDAKLYQNAYTRVQLVADYGEKQCEEMVEYYIQLIEKYIIDCKNKLIEESKSNQSNLIEGFILYTTKINFLIYWMVRVFCYLDRYHTKAKYQKSLSQFAMELYKSNFYAQFKDNIQNEINNLKSEEKNGNEESNIILKNIIEILEDLKLQKPKITKVNGIIKWVNEM